MVDLEAFQPLLGERSSLLEELELQVGQNEGHGARFYYISLCRSV